MKKKHIVIGLGVAIVWAAAVILGLHWVVNLLLEFGEALGRAA